jgi:hypothetical protein
MRAEKEVSSRERAYLAGVVLRGLYCCASVERHLFDNCGPAAGRGETSLEGATFAIRTNP